LLGKARRPWARAAAPALSGARQYPSRYRLTNWARKVLVEATATSGPARVYQTASTARVRLLPMTLVTPRGP
jgi:hypothetical protein